MTRRLLLLLAMAALCFAPAAVHAGKPKRYFFELIEVKAVPTVGDHAAELIGLVKAKAVAALAAHPQVAATLTDAPAADAGFPIWKKYLTRQKLDGAYRVNVEITGYEETVEDLDPGDKIELRLTIRLSLRMFGEVLPMRTMGFAGDGVSTIKADVGRRLRPRDRDFNLAGAVDLAVGDALAASLKKIESAPPPKKK